MDWAAIYDSNLKLFTNTIILDRMVVKGGFMTKLSRKFRASDKMGEYLNQLWSAFTLADSKEDIKTLFLDLFSHTEYKMFAKRFQIARRLLEGQDYDEITRDLNVSHRTIANINNVLATKGIGLRKTHIRLLDIEKKRRNLEHDRIKKLSRPFNPKLPGQDVLPNAIVEGFKYLDKKITKSIKQRSARKSI